MPAKMATHHPSQKQTTTSPTRVNLFSYLKSPITRSHSQSQSQTTTTPKSTLSSPLLQNSSFADIDYFSTPSSSTSSTPTSASPVTPGTPSFTPTPTRHSSPGIARKVVVMSVPPLGRNVNVGAGSRFVEGNERCDTPLPDVMEEGCIELSSPKVLSSPGSGFGESRAKRRSIQFSGEVNWARPIKEDVEVQPSPEKSNAHLFGYSAQRARRLDRRAASSIDLTESSPTTSSSAESSSPMTPHLDSSPSIPNLNWSLASEGSGLGYPSSTWDSPSPLDDYFDEVESTSPPSHRSMVSTPTPVHSPARLMTTSQSLYDLSQPSNLDELKYLRQAASDLEAEARLPLRTISPNTLNQASIPSTSTSARKIRRKAVPSLDASDIASSSTSTSTPNPSPISYTHIPATPLFQPTPIPITTLPALSTPRQRSETARPPILEKPVFPFRNIGTESPSPSGKPKRSFYQSHLATRSLASLPLSLNISPRGGSLPFSIPKRQGSSPLNNSQSPNPSVASTRTETTSTSGYSGSGSGSGSGSSASSVSEKVPVTPSVAEQERDAWLSGLDAGLIKLEGVRTGFEGSGKRAGDGEASPKFKRGFSRFFTRRAAEV